ncbi:unnamed protein product [Didymodactylos carnosus]|uniref:TATA element modulatory factor 1 TATA binding domain-containing protein n=1 Tax=Didymodactylos carnosus TaxID=1234261 RepID=A0A813UD90_9BILA|nr:unnamed protein product [Didymodactylos carnosus]CAF0821794.1 unnamed protein product [Didymodactylos carnosus]CAF3590143.1 unnamed protein product [Didymodactylos carnosus]CAF3608255.1 unnamed protein product [Didymodactylos carnosus]
MSSWFIDSNKLKQFAASTLINAQKQIDKVLDIKEGATPSQTTSIPTTNANEPVSSSSDVVQTTADEFFTAFLGSDKEKSKSHTTQTTHRQMTRAQTPPYRSSTSSLSEHQSSENRDVTTRTSDHLVEISNNNQQQQNRDEISQKKLTTEPDEQQQQPDIEQENKIQSFDSQAISFPMNASVWEGSWIENAKNRNSDNQNEVAEISSHENQNQISDDETKIDETTESSPMIQSALIPSVVNDENMQKSTDYQSFFQSVIDSNDQSFVEEKHVPIKTIDIDEEEHVAVKTTDIDEEEQVATKTTDIDEEEHVAVKTTDIDEEVSSSTYSTINQTTEPQKLLNDDDTPVNDLLAASPLDNNNNDSIDTSSTSTTLTHNSQTVITSSSSSSGGGGQTPSTLDSSTTLVPPKQLEKLTVRISESSSSTTTTIAEDKDLLTPKPSTFDHPEFLNNNSPIDTFLYEQDMNEDEEISLATKNRNVIDLWMNKESNILMRANTSNNLSFSTSPAYFDNYPPSEFHTSMIEPTVATQDQNQQLKKDIQPGSPTHTTTSSNGPDNTSGKDSSAEDEKQTSCASSDIDIISSPSINGGSLHGYDNCREFVNANRQNIREVVVKFPHQGLKQQTPNTLNMPTWSSLIEQSTADQMLLDSQDEFERPLSDEEQKNHTTNPSVSKELSDIKKKLELKEQTISKLTNENLEVRKTNQTLKQSLAESELKLVKITNEFQQTIENLTLRLEQQKPIVQDRDNLRKQLDTLQKELFDSSTVSGNTLNILRDKEEQIQQLLDEGEKLSKTQLQHTNIIKKLRTKEKEMELTVNTQNAKIEKLTTELDDLKKSSEGRDETDKQLRENLKKYEKNIQHYEKECLSLKSLLEDAEEQNRSMKVALESSYRDITELNKTKAASESKVVEATLSAEIVLKEEIRLAIDKERLQSRQEQEKLHITIDDLRHTIQRTEQNLSRREQLLRQEINDLRQRLQEAEARNEELTQNISHATRPLLRQIENLQTTYLAQINSLEKAEKQLTDRLADMQMQYATSIEHERIANENLHELNTKLKLLEAQLNTLRQEKMKNISEIDVLKMRLSTFEDTKLRERSQMESMQEAFTQQINSLIQEKKQLEMDFELERIKYDNDLKKLQFVQDSLRERQELLENRQLNRTESNLETLSSQRSRRSSQTETSLSSTILQSEQRSPFIPTPKPSVYEALRNTGAIAVLESLESQLKEKEGEIALLQSEIADLERTRESMARELVNLSNQNELLQSQLRDYPTLEIKFKQFQQRYDALLTMYGEKQEEADELRLDLQDVKALYRAQNIKQLKKRQKKIELSMKSDTEAAE